MGEGGIVGRNKMMIWRRPHDTSKNVGLGPAVFAVGAI